MSSSSEILTQARRLGTYNVLIEDYEEDPHSFEPWDPSANQQNMVLVPKRSMVETRVFDSQEPQPSTSINPAAFLNGSTTDIRLDSGDVSVIDHAHLCFKITNSTGASCTLAQPSFWIQRLEVLSPGSSNPLTVIEDIGSWLSLCMLPRTEFENIAALAGTTTAYATSGVVIADAASTELYLPLLTLFNAVRLHLSGLKAQTGSITLRLITKPSAQCIITGAHPTFTGFTALLNGFDEPTTIRAIRTNFYAGGRIRINRTEMSRVAIALPHLGWQRNTYQTTLSANVKADIRLNGLNGTYAALFFVIRALPLTAANSGTFLRMDIINLADGDGNFIGGNYTKSHARTRAIMASTMPSLAGLNSNFYVVPFSSQFCQDFFVGQNHGYKPLNGSEVLSLTPATGFSSAQYQIDVYCLRQAALIVRNGEISLRY